MMLLLSVFGCNVAVRCVNEFGAALASDRSLDACSRNQGRSVSVELDLALGAG
jgi:hypothetical protein